MNKTIEKKSYREQIQELIRMMEHIYDAAGNLRDHATMDEKHHWNEIRGLFYSEPMKPLRRLDNEIDQDRAKELMPDYAKFTNQTSMF